MATRLPTQQWSQRAWTWLHANLFSTWYNVLLTIGCVLFFGVGLYALGTWIWNQAQWDVIRVNHRLFMVGRYPVQQLWRVWTLLAWVVATVSLSWGVMQGNSRGTYRVVGVTLFGLLVFARLVRADWSAWAWLGGIGGVAIASLHIGPFLPRICPKSGLRWGLPLLWLLTFFGVFWLLGGGLGLTPVRTSLWSGLLQTLLMATVSIALSFPLGVLLALGRRSDLPLIRIVSVLYIEVMRGLPLISILFMAQVMLPLVLPINIQLDQMLRAIAGLTLFSAAYLAENVRGGLQSVPKGQTEAAQALGLHPVFIIGLIILPQALRAVVPAIVGQFIGLFKDTSLLAYAGLVELTGIARSILSQPAFVGRFAEGYLFIGCIYWIFCYLMSVGSRRLEQQL